MWCRTLLEEGVRWDCVGGRGLVRSRRGWTCRGLGSRPGVDLLGFGSAGLSKAGHIRWALFAISRGFRQQVLVAFALRMLMLILGINNFVGLAHLLLRADSHCGATHGFWKPRCLGFANFRR